MEWPQITMIVLWFLNICIYASKNGEPREDNYDLGTTLAAIALSAFLLYHGGFFSGV